MRKANSIGRSPSVTAKTQKISQVSKSTIKVDKQKKSTAKV